MARSNDPFTPLGQIISGGGLRSVALGMRAGWTEERITRHIREKQPEATASEIDELRRIAESTLSASQSLTRQLSRSRAQQSERAGIALEIADLEQELVQFKTTRDESGRFIRLIEFGDTTELTLGEIPIVPELFGNESGGARIDMSMDVRSADGGQPFRIDAELVGDETLDDLLDLVPAWQRKWEQESPDSFHKAAMKDLDTLLVEITYIARKF